MVKGYGRLVAATAAGVLLLTGCGSDSAAGKPDAKKPAATEPAKPAEEPSTKGPSPEQSDPAKASPPAPIRPKALTEAELTALMPMDALPGWRKTGGPLTEDMRKPLPGGYCARSNPSCEGLAYLTNALLLKEDAGTAAFLVYAYRDTRAAQAAYSNLWAATARQVPPPHKPITLGPVGEQRDAQRGERPGMGTSAMIQVRVGTTVLVIETGGLGGNRPTDAQVTDWAAMFAERSRQAQAGETPSARAGN